MSNSPDTHPSITFKLGNLAHCNELADRYFHVGYLSWVTYLCSALCTLKPKKPLKNSKKPRFFPALLSTLGQQVASV